MPPTLSKKHRCESRCSCNADLVRKCTKYTNAECGHRHKECISYCKCASANENLPGCPDVLMFDSEQVDAGRETCYRYYQAAILHFSRGEIH